MLEYFEGACLKILIIKILFSNNSLFKILAIIIEHFIFDMLTDGRMVIFNINVHETTKQEYVHKTKRKENVIKSQNLKEGKHLQCNETRKRSQNRFKRHAVSRFPK